MIRLQGQAPGGGVSVNGIQFQCDDNGVLELPDGNEAAASVLCESHGFTKIDMATAPAAAAASKPSADPIDLRAAGEPEAPKQPEGERPNGEQIDPMTATREQLKAWLSERKVEFVANTPTEKLRKLVVDALIVG